MAAAPVNFVSQSELNAKKELKRKTREEKLRKAKDEYEHAERHKQRRKETGEETWMLASVNHRVSDKFISTKKKKRKKDKKAKKKKSKKPKKEEKEKGSSDDTDSESESEEEWVVKETDHNKPVAAPQRDSWMLLPTFSLSEKRARREPDETKEMREEEKKLSCHDMPGQHQRELNPFWKDGGEGLPAAREEDTAAVYDIGFLRRAYQRSREQSEEEGRPLEEVVADRWGSLERLQSLMKAAEERSTQGQSCSSAKWKTNKSIENSIRSRSRRNEEKWGRYDIYKKGHGRTVKESGVNRDTNTTRDKHSDGHKGQGRERQGNREGERQEKGGTREPRRRENKSGQTKFMRPDDSDVRVSSSGNIMQPPTAATPSRSTRDFPSTDKEKKPAAWKKNYLVHVGVTNQKVEAKCTASSGSESDGSAISGEETSSQTNEDMPSLGKSEGDNKSTQRKKITEMDLNNMGAKILRAELMGNTEQITMLKSELEKMRKDKEAQVAADSGTEGTVQEVVVLTRTDRRGNTRPVQIAASPQHNRSKKHKVATHSTSGERERYFADDDQFSLHEMVRMERMHTAEDHDSMFSRLASKDATRTDSESFTLDDHFVTAAATKQTPTQAGERQKRKAIAEHKRLSKQLSKCRFCFENPDLKKHLIVAIGMQVYLALPLHMSLTEGHCLIIPMQHSLATTMIDEDVYDEIKVFKKGLTQMFDEMDRDVIFLETCRNIKQQSHIIIECIPVPKKEGDMAPIYFKKAIVESDVEWALNKRLIHTQQKGLRNSIPKGLPYFSVEFGLDGGFAHVIEDEQLFPHYFGKEIIGGMLDLELHKWRKPRKENFEEHKKKVLQFADWWKPYDWTQRLGNPIKMEQV